MQKTRMTEYVAPEGFVYDYAIPRFSMIKELDGSVTQVEEHLYAKYLYLTRFDDINNYKTVTDPKAVNNNDKQNQN